MKLTATLDSATRLASAADEVMWRSGVGRVVVHGRELARSAFDAEFADVKVWSDLTSSRHQLELRDGCFVVGQRCSWGGCFASATVIHTRDRRHRRLPAEVRPLCAQCAKRHIGFADGSISVGVKRPLIAMPSLELVQELEFAFALLARLGRG